MKREFEQDTLEMPTTFDLIGTEKLIELKMFGIKVKGNVEEIIAMDSRCNHTGRCGSSNHQGNGYCHWCKICNPSNPRAY